MKLLSLKTQFYQKCHELKNHNVCTKTSIIPLFCSYILMKKKQTFRIESSSDVGRFSPHLKVLKVHLELFFLDIFMIYYATAESIAKVIEKGL